MWLHHVMGMLVLMILKKSGAKHRQYPRGKPGYFHQTMGDEFTCQQDNNLKLKSKSTLELFTKKTVNVPEWLNYSFDTKSA
jgi:hypothetical protein